MTTVICTYKLPTPKTREEISAIFNFAAQTMFKNMDGLNSKQFCYDEKTGEGLSVYHWNSYNKAQEFFHSPSFVADFEAALGTKPEFKFLDCLVMVDNRTNDILLSPQSQSHILK